MKTRRVTEDIVKEAAQQLNAEGRAATTRNVRLQLGFGSNTTIGHHLQQLGLADAGRSEPTAEIERAVAELHSSFVRRTCLLVARQVADCERGAARRASDRVHHLVTQLNASKTERSALELELHRVRGDLHRTRQRVTQVLAELAQKSEELAVANALRERAEKARQQPREDIVS